MEQAVSLIKRFITNNAFQAHLASTFTKKDAWFVKFQTPMKKTANKNEFIWPAQPRAPRRAVPLRHNNGFDEIEVQMEPEPAQEAVNRVIDNWARVDVPFDEALHRAQMNLRQAQEQPAFAPYIGNPGNARPARNPVRRPQ
jgi:hypothetical protein